MYNEREKLFHHQQLHSPKEAAADLALLKKLNPYHPRLKEFEFSPSRSAGDILLVLLGIVHRDDIVKNRLQFKQVSEPEPAPKPEPTPEPEPAPEPEPTPEPEPAPGEEEDPEKQELKDQLEEKEEEVADLQDQLEEKEDQIADLEEKLEEEKKSETPVKTPAKKTAAKKTAAKKSTSKKK